MKKLTAIYFVIVALLQSFLAPLRELHRSQAGVLTADKNVVRKEAGLQEYPVASAETIYKGALVMVSATGYLEAGVDSSAKKFAGISYEKKDNTLGSDGTLNCRVHTRGRFKITASNITQSMVGQMMYLVDDQTIDDTSTNLIPVGVLMEFIGSTEGWIDIETALPQAALPADIVNGAKIADDAVGKEHLADGVYTIEHITLLVSATDNETLGITRVRSACTVVRVVYWTSGALGSGKGIDILDGGVAGSGVDVIDSSADDLDGFDSSDLGTPYALSADDYIRVKFDDFTTAPDYISIDIQLKVPLGTAV